MDRYQLRYFLAVVEAGNFSKAAARANVAQPTLSVGIAKLETELGTKLFQRSSRRVHLTESGSRFLPHARRIMQDFNLARQAVADAESTEVLRVGTLATLPAGLLERIVSVARGMDPLQQLEILDGSEREIANMLDEGRIDLAITLIRPGTERATDEILLKEDYCAVLPDRHRLASAGMVRGEELASETMILRRHCEVLAETSRYFTDRNVRPLFGFVTTSDERALAMVRAGLGVTVMAAGNAMPGIALARLKGFGLERRIGLRRGERSVAEGGAFAAAARSCLQSAGEEGGPHARS